MFGGTESGEAEDVQVSIATIDLPASIITWVRNLLWFQPQVTLPLAIPLLRLSQP